MLPPMGLAMAPLPNGNPFMSMNNYSNGVGQISATGAVIKFFTLSGSATVRSTGMAGVGLFFEREMHDGSYFPVIKDITQKGSAYREGTIKTSEILLSVDGKSCREMSLTELKGAVIGTIGTVADLMVLNKSDSMQRLVKLSRAPVEYWVLYDANVEWKTKYDTLHDKAKENEQMTFKYKGLSEDLQKTLRTLDESVNTMQLELAKQRELSRVLSAQNAALSLEKKSLESNVDNMLKKNSEITLHFKTAEALAREMTEKARQSEGSRLNEERIRKMSEDRESKVQKELSIDVQKRREAEHRVTGQADRIAELEDRLQMAMVAESDNKRLHGEILVLRADTDAAKADFEAARAGEKKYEAEMLKEQKEVASSRIELELLKKTMAALTDKTKSLEIAAERAVKEKDAVIVGEQELVAETQKASARISELETKIARLHAESGNLQIQFESEQEKVRSTTTAKTLAVEAKEDMEVAVVALKTEVIHLKTSMEAFANETSVSMLSLENGVVRAQTETIELSKRLKDTTATATTDKHNLETKVREATEWSDKVKSDLTAADAKLAAALEEMERMHTMIQGFELSVAKAEADARAANDAVLKATAQSQALQAQVKELESDAAVCIQNLQQQKTLASKEASENKAATAGYAKIEQEMADLTTRLSNSESSAKDLDVLGNTWEEKCRELEVQLAARMGAAKDMAVMGTKVSALSHELAGLTEERNKLQDADAKHLSLLNSTVQKHEELMARYTTEAPKLKNDYEKRIRQLQDEYDYCNKDRQDAHTEIARFLAMPNPCGVGMALGEVTVQGTKTITVQGMQGGLSADLCGIITKGDELVQVNEFVCDDMTLPDVQAKVTGNRGTQVAFRLRRAIVEGKHKGETFDYRIVLKRGAWGPAHCCMTPEDLDMIDVGRWPAKGAVTSETVDMEKITNGKDASLNYDVNAKDHTASSRSKGIELAAKHGIELIGLEAMNRMTNSLAINSGAPPSSQNK